MDASQIITDLGFAIQNIIAGTASIFEGRIKNEWLIYNVRLPGNIPFINLQYHCKSNGISKLGEKPENTYFLIPKKVTEKDSRVSAFDESSVKVANIEESSGTLKEIEEIQGDTLGDDKTIEIQKQPVNIRPFNTETYISHENLTLDLNKVLSSASICSQENSKDESMIEGKGEIELKIRTNTSEEKRFTLNRKIQIRCRYCKERFDTLMEKERHETIHEAENRYSCEVCGKSFRNLSKLNVHKKTHKDKHYTCDHCGKSFYSTSYLNKHIEKNHVNISCFLCEFCNKVFKRKDKLKEHQITHTGERPYKCEYCGKSYYRLDILRQHRRLHKEKRLFLCLCCGKCFTVSSDLIHFQRTQSGEKLYKCEYCEKSFVQLDHLTAHKQQHTGRPYYCILCWKSFIQKSLSTTNQANEDVNTSNDAAKNEINS